MLALDEYIENTSLTRAFLVSIATFVPVAAIVVVQESIPLQHLEEGWSANYGFWARFVVLAVSASYTTATHFGIMVEGANLSPRQFLLFSAHFAVVFTALVVVMASVWIFPIPFVAMSASLPAFVALVVSFRVAVGDRIFREVAARRDQILAYNKFGVVQWSMAMVYPIYQVAFRASIDSKWELPVLMLLPVIKTFLKSIFVRTFTGKEDMGPEGVIFTIDFFDALYLATCVQSVTSITSVVVLMTIDILQTTVELYDLHDRMRHICGTDKSLLSEVIQSLNQDRSRKSISSDISVYSCIAHRLSSKRRAFLETLDKYLVRRAVCKKVSERATRTKRSIVVRSNVVIPNTAVIPSGGERTNSKASAKIPSAKLLDLDEALEVLFTAECLVLTEYLEAAIPILYGSFLVMMVHFPSAQFHQEMEGVTRHNVIGMVQIMLTYAVLELVSLVVLAVIMQRTCGIRALHHLAFVLETQAPLVQSKLIMWTVVTLSFRVAHFGTIDGEESLWH
ncbi:hypothetical protein PHYBOEH_011859 [Phytophthora boehmeriae]|uniref:Uncharacterized protein n=1 Tax=Phytophthora boehmeriae TaxID=109152 RepID=A0A8T1WW06_9STRA|nr:hypothetical protein PHYBOEH_011859 [Phytophthora boehmeriae]